MSVKDSARAVVECRVCGGTDWQDIVAFGAMPLTGSFLEPSDSYEDEDRYPLGVISCRSCRLMSLTHVVDPEVLYRNYFYVSSDSDLITQHMRTLAKLAVERFEIPRDSLVVEIGSNTGTQLEFFQEAGMRILGVDPARNLAEVANANGIETLPLFFAEDTAADVAQRYGRARLILGRHCFAHIDDVASVARGALALLEHDGVFAVEVPYLLDMLENAEFDTIYHEHLSYYGVGTLDRLFDRQGMRVVDVERLPEVHGGSILVFAARSDGPWRPQPVVAELIELETRSGVYDDAAYVRFAQRTAQTAETMASLVRDLVAQGKRIAGYGAPAKGITLLNVSGLGTAELEFCSDTTPLKQGKVMPGSHIPIRSPEYGREHAPDYYVLLAWNYAKEIIRKERAYLEAGGRFIVPIPEPRIIELGSPEL